MSYPYVDRSIEGPLLVIESVDRVMPCISTLLEKGQIRPPYSLTLTSKQVNYLSCCLLSDARRVKSLTIFEAIHIVFV